MGSLIKNILFAVVIAAVLWVSYQIFFVNDEAAITADTVQVQTQAAIETQAFLIRLQQLQNIELDNGLFSDARFRSLADHRQSMVDEPAGRPNPFAPIGQ